MAEIKFNLTMTLQKGTKLPSKTMQKWLGRRVAECLKEDQYQDCFCTNDEKGTEFFFSKVTATPQERN